MSGVFTRVAFSFNRENSSVYGMSAIGAYRQEHKQRYLNDTGPDHGVGRPKRQTAQTQKLKIGDGIKDTGLDTCAAGREDAAQPGGQRPRHCHGEHHRRDAEHQSGG